MDRYNSLIWRVLFVTCVLGYALAYAPFGINESDGGFLTGFAWQVVCGKTLYQDVIYVRPPLPVWLRALEIKMLPETWQTLGERWIFYLKIAAYSWLAADIFCRNYASTYATIRPTFHIPHPCQLAVFAFVVSAHNYPPTALHTFDGILFSVLGLWFLPRNWWLAAACVFAATLCKQSFYPMAVVFLASVFVQRGTRASLESAAVMVGLAAIFAGYLWANGLMDNYLRFVGGSAEGSKAVQTGIVNYFRINPVVAAGSVLCFLPALVVFLKTPKSVGKWLGWGWLAFLCWLSVSYAWEAWSRQAFFIPFSQSRLLFWAAAAWLVFQFRQGRSVAELAPFAGLLAVSWCGSVSWGYQLPIQFAAPGVFAAAWFAVFFVRQIAEERPLFFKMTGFAALLGLVGVFRVGHEFVYRDGRRAEMRVHLGDTFPKLSGIYSDKMTAAKYLELKNLAAAWPGPKAVLPIFGQADFVLDQVPVLPTNWLVNRETAGHNELVFKTLAEKRPVLFIDKAYADVLFADPEYAVTADILRRQKMVGEAEFFWIYEWVRD